MTVATPSHRRKGKHDVLAMKHRKASLSEEELIERKERDKVRKASKKASETRLSKFRLVPIKTTLLNERH